MQWRVDGASEESGEEMTLTLDAPSREVAELLARQRGLLVASITSLQPLSAADEVALAQRAKVSQPLAYLSRNASPPAPKYVGLRIAASALGVMAILYYLGGGFLLAMTTYAVFGRKFIPSGLEGLLEVLEPAFVLLAVGAGCHGLSAGCIALRDIAINSFSRRP